MAIAAPVLAPAFPNCAIVFSSVALASFKAFKEPVSNNSWNFACFSWTFWKWPPSVLNASPKLPSKAIIGNTLILKNPNSFISIKKNAFKTAKKYTWDNRANKIINFFEKKIK